MRSLRAAHRETTRRGATLPPRQFHHHSQVIVRLDVTMNKLDTAIKQLRTASNNLSDHAAETGATRSCEASRLVSQLLNALQFGPCYPTVSHAEAFDVSNSGQVRDLGSRRR